MNETKFFLGILYILGIVVFTLGFWDLRTATFGYWSPYFLAGILIMLGSYERETRYKLSLIE